jgi:iron complex transport system substrate-binding protein
MKRIVAMLLAITVALGACACGTDVNAPETKTTVATEAETIAETEAETTTAAIREPYTFTDSCGREVEIPGEVTRIVPSGPLAQIVLFAIAPEMLVGLATEWNDSAKGFIPQEYYELPYFGQLYGSADLNVEELALAEPQLIIDVGEAKKSIVEDMDNLQTQTTIPSIHISANLETMPQAFRTLGTILGKEDKGEELAAFCEKVYKRTVGIMEKVGDNKVKGLYVLGEEGLNVLAKGTFHAEIIDMMIDNLAIVDEPSGRGFGNTVDMEQIALWNPDWVIFGPGSIYGNVKEMPAWQEVPAIVNGNYVEVPEGPHNWLGMPPSVQRYLGLIWLPSVLYPDQCDYDMKAEVMEYYKLFYSCEKTEDQYKTLTANAFLK